MWLAISHHRFVIERHRFVIIVDFNQIWTDFAWLVRAELGRLRDHDGAVRAQVDRGLQLFEVREALGARQGREVRECAGREQRRVQERAGRVNVDAAMRLRSPMIAALVLPIVSEWPSVSDTASENLNSVSCSSSTSIKI